MDVDDDLSDAIDQNKPSTSHTPGQELSKKRRASPTKDAENKTKVKRTYYHKGGLVHSLHGNIYQLKMQMLFLKRALDNECEFQLGTEVEDADKFDDIVFKYKLKDNSGVDSVRFVQIKHKQDESKEITVQDLLQPYNTNNNDFSLQKYFISYKKILRNPGYSNFTKKDFIIFTNINFTDFENESIKIENVDEHDNDILEMKNSDKDTEHCKLIIPKNQDLYEKLRETSNIHVLAKALKQNILEDKRLDLNSDIFKTYHIALSNKILEIPVLEKNKKGKTRTAKFSDDFLNNDGLSEDASQFRKILQYVLNLDNRTFQETLIKKELKVSENFGKLKTTVLQSLVDKVDRISIEPKDKEEQDVMMLPTDKIEDAEIEDFFKNLIFAVNQPNENELGTIIAYEIGESSQFNLLNANLVSDSFQRIMLDWFKAKRPEKNEEGVWLNAQSGHMFMRSIEQKVSSLISIGINVTYPEKLAAYGIRFNANDVSKILKDFLSKENVLKDVLHVKAAKETLLSAINIYNALKDLKSQEEFSLYKKDDSHIYMQLNTLLGKRSQKYVIDAFKSKDNHHLLIIDGNREKPTTGIRKVFMNLCKIVQKSKKKIILISTQHNNLGNEFYESCRFDIIDNIGFIDLTEKSKETLLQKEIIFQGRKVRFNVLINKSNSNTKDIIDVDIMHKLLKGEEIIISKKPQGLGEVQDYYIHRKLRQAFPSKEFIQEYLNKNGNHSDFFVISGAIRLMHNNVFVFDNNELAEIKFQELCLQFPHLNVHWLESTSENILIWYKTHGSISNILDDDRKYSPLIDVAEFIFEKNHQKVVVISNTAGMGKSTILNKISSELKKALSNLWIIRIDLNNHTALLDKALRNINKLELTDHIKNELVDCLLKNLVESQEQSEIERKIFYHHGKVAFLFDGFDEISPRYKDIVIYLLQALQKSKAEKVFVTTRPNLRKILERKLGVFFYELEPLSKDDQKQFLTRYWTSKLNLSHFDESISKKTDTYVNHVIEVVYKLIDHAFIGIPLQTMMIAKVFQENQTIELTKWQGFKEFLESEDDVPNPLQLQSLLDLYKHFIRKRFYEILLTTKRQRVLTIVGEKEAADEEYRKFEEKYALLALKALFDDIQLNDLLSEGQVQKLTSVIEGFKNYNHNEGIVDIFVDDKPQFVHRTFAEYFAAFAIAKKFLAAPADTVKFIDDVIMYMSPIFMLNIIDQLDGKQETITTALNMPLMYFVLRNNHMNFIHSLVRLSTNWHRILDKFGKTPLHYAAEYGSSNTELGIQHLFHELYTQASMRPCKYLENSRLLMKFIYKSDVSGQSAFDIAFGQNNSSNIDYSRNEIQYELVNNLIQSLLSTILSKQEFI